MIKNRATLKSYFETNDVPTEQEFINLIESYLHLTDDGATKIKELLAASKLTASHIDVEDIWDAFTNAIGAGANFGQLGYTSAETLNIATGVSIEFEAYLSSVQPASKLIWGIFQGANLIAVKAGSNFSHAFDTAGTYTLTVTAKNVNNSTIATLTIEDWIVVVDDPATGIITQAQIEIPQGTADGVVVDCEISGTDITCEVPNGTNLLELIPKIVFGGTLTGIENGKVTDMSSPITFNVDGGTSDEDYTLTVSEAT